MSSSNKKVMSLEQKVRIIRMYTAVTQRGVRQGYRLLYHEILDDKQRILAQYDAMKAKLAAVRDLVITEYGKPNYIVEKHAFLEKVISEWYQRAAILKEMKKIPLALFGHKTDIALRILNITDLPLSNTQLHNLKSKCLKASLERRTKFESTTLIIKKIAKELLVKMGISKATAISMYGPDIFEEPNDGEDDEDDEEFLRHKLQKRKLEQQEQPPCKTARTSNAAVGWDLERDWTEDEDEDEEELTDSDSDTNSAHSKDWHYEVEVNEDNRSEEEDIELYDVISVEDSSEEFDAATSSKNIIPDLLIKKECETSTGSGEEGVAPLIKAAPVGGQCVSNVHERAGELLIKKDSEEFDAASSSKNIIPDLLIKKECETSTGSGEEGVAPLIKAAPVGGQCVSNVHERAGELLIKKDCDTTDEECGNIKTESEVLDLNCDSVPTTTCSRDCEKQAIEETNSDDDRLVHLYTVASEDSSDTDSASRSMENDRCVENYEDVMHILKLLKAYLQHERNGRALEALDKVEAAFPQSAKK